MFDVKREWASKKGTYTFPDHARTAAEKAKIGPDHRWVPGKDVTLIGTAGHLHPGGLHTDLNAFRGNQRRRLFRSTAKYWEPAGASWWDVAMTATPPDWLIKMKAGDVLKVSATYDAKRASWYESMGIMPVFYYEGHDVGGTDPFTGTVKTTGSITHGRLPENDNHGGRKVILPDARRLLRRAAHAAREPPRRDPQLLLRPVDLALSGDAQRPPTVRPGQALKFKNIDAGGDDVYHTITACKEPCKKDTGIAYPLADGRVDFDSGGSAGPEFASPTAQRDTWSTPKNRRRARTRTSAVCIRSCAGRSASRAATASAASLAGGARPPVSCSLLSSRCCPAAAATTSSARSRRSATTSSGASSAPSEEFEERRERYGKRIDESSRDLEKAFERPERTSPTVRSRGRNEPQTIDAFLTDVLEDVDRYWTRTFATADLPEPRVAYNGSRRASRALSGCGEPADDMSAFYCPADDTIYVGQQFAADAVPGRPARAAGRAPAGRAAGDFAVAYVLAHEYAHNLQQELGIFDNRVARVGQAVRAAGRLPGRDVGVLGLRRGRRCSPATSRRRRNAALAVGDFDFGNAQHHGTPGERRDALLAGFKSGDPSICNRFLG